MKPGHKRDELVVRLWIDLPLHSCDPPTATAGEMHRKRMAMTLR